MKSVIVSLSEVNSRRWGWSAELHVNIAEGKLPYVMINNQLKAIHSGGSIPVNAVYMKQDDVDRVNHRLSLIKTLQGEIDQIKGSAN